jgi:serine/threonine protein kinase
MDELKVMSYIGSHPNIVLLLGAQTAKLKENKLFLVLEYCHLGSLKSYLKGQRSKEILECPDDSNSIESGFESATSDYVPPPDMDKVYVKDFVSYAYQIAYGMNYLTQKRIIHSDIATRNVLLMDRNIVKITDFGLSKRMSDYQEYVRNNQEFVPWRWWSIESLRDFTFTSKSDVWSYGVALWEIFTLAQVPHPEQTWNPEFSKKLENGLRLLKPPLASDQIYEIMSQCWAVKPEERPTFQILCDQLRQILRKMSKNEADYGDSQGSATKHSPHYVTTEPIDA